MFYIFDLLLLKRQQATHAPSNRNTFIQQSNKRRSVTTMSSVAPLTWSLCESIDYPVKGGWKDGELLCCGQVVDVTKIDGLDGQGSKGFQKGMVFFSAHPVFVVKFQEKHQRYAKMCDPGHPNLPYLLYRGRPYYVPDCLDMNHAEFAMSENGNLCVVLPRGIKLVHM